MVVYWPSWSKVSGLDGVVAQPESRAEPARARAMMVLFILVLLIGDPALAAGKYLETAVRLGQETEFFLGRFTAQNLVAMRIASKTVDNDFMLNFIFEIGLIAEALK